VLIAAALAGRGVASAQSGIEVRSNTAQSDFPNGISFQLCASATSGFEDIRLVYQIAPDGVSASAVPQCTPGSDTPGRYQLAGSQQDTIIPGAEVTTSGDDFRRDDEETPRRSYTKTAADWKTITEQKHDDLVLQRRRRARAVLEAGQRASSAPAPLQTTVRHSGKAHYYRTADECSRRSSRTQRGRRHAGVRSSTRHGHGRPPTRRRMDIARHEIVLRPARGAEGAYNPPDWVTRRGGLPAVAAHQGPGEAVESAIRNNTVPRGAQHELSSGGLSSNVLLFYGESWSLVKFLIETYGEQKFADLYRAIDAGAGTPGALQQVYGFSEDGLENAWRASVGLPPRDVPTPEDGALAPRDNETASSSQTADDASGLKTVLIVA
jgi:hypothetical protein